MQATSRTLKSILRRRFAVAAVAVALACGLVPALAFADADLQAAGVDAPAKATAAQTKMVDVYVIKSEKQVNKRAKHTVNTTYSYNDATGLLAEKSDSTRNPYYSEDTTTSYKYDKNSNVKQQTMSQPGSTATKTFTITKNGVYKGDVQKAKPYAAWQPYKSAYKTTKGKVTTIVRKYSGYGTKGTTTYQVKYKGSKITSIAMPYSQYKSVNTYSYNKQGNLSKTVGMKGNQKVPVVHSYKLDKNGNVTKHAITVQTSQGTTTTTTYKWKKISVPKAMAAKVKAQQWALVNGNFNCAFGPMPAN